MTQEDIAYLKALAEWYASEVKRVLDGGGGYSAASGSPGSSPPPKPPVVN